jgi:hypothetical protein
MRYDTNINIPHNSGIGYLHVSTLSYVDGFLRLSADQPIVDYYNRAGITDLEAKQNISDFYLGLNKLNLWDNTDNFYLLKSGYNQITGTTVYGFKTGYDGFLPNLDQTIWTSTGIYLKSGFSTPNSSFSWECSGKGVIIHKAFENLLEGNSTVVVLGKTNISDAEYGYGSWWHQVDRSAGQRAIWHNANAYYNYNEFQYGSGNFIPTYVGAPRLSTGQQYNIISYSNTFYPSLYNQYSGSGFLTVYKDSNLIANTPLTGTILPRLCTTWPYYPCTQYSGFIGGFYDYEGGPSASRLGAKNNSYIVFAAAFSKVLSHAEHSGLNNLILNTIAKNISLG